MFGRLVALVLACVAMASPVAAQSWQCAPFARQVSGIQLFGNAGTWWHQAEGRYDRGDEPQVGAVLVIKASGAMRVGHVATVSEIVDDRTVKLTHANWSRRGGVEEDVVAIDVSEAGDWSAVRVWYGPIGDIGTRAHPAYGFVYQDEAARTVARIAPRELPQIELAAVEAGPSGPVSIR
jgi:surface antigen